MKQQSPAQPMWLSAKGSDSMAEGCSWPEDQDELMQSNTGAYRRSSTKTPRYSSKASLPGTIARASLLYVNEYASPLIYFIKSEVPSVREAVVSANVVLYLTESCSFCDAATSILDDERIAYKKYYPSDSETADLKKSLGVPLIAFPAIFIRGMYLGSLDRLEDVRETGELQNLLKLPVSPLGKLPDPLNLCVAARGGSIFSFQRYCYCSMTATC